MAVYNVPPEEMSQTEVTKILQSDKTPIMLLSTNTPGRLFRGLGCNSLLVLVQARAAAVCLAVGNCEQAEVNK